MQLPENDLTRRMRRLSPGGLLADGQLPPIRRGAVQSRGTSISNRRTLTGRISKRRGEEGNLTVIISAHLEKHSDRSPQSSSHSPGKKKAPALPSSSSHPPRRTISLRDTGPLPQIVTASVFLSNKRSAPRKAPTNWQVQPWLTKDKTRALGTHAL